MIAKPLSAQGGSMTDREKIIYDILCSDEQPPEGQHWEGFVTNKIVAALAQPEPEPFEYWNAVEGWVKIEEVRQHFDTAGCGTIYKTSGEGRVPLYTAPQREWQGLTDEEIGEIADDENYGYMDVARAIQAKLKEKNG